MKKHTDPLTDLFLDMLWDFSGIDVNYWIGQIIIYLTIAIGGIYFLSQLSLQ
jgi:hypothetical protein